MEALETIGRKWEIAILCHLTTGSCGVTRKGPSGGPGRKKTKTYVFVDPVRTTMVTLLCPPAGRCQSVRNTWNNYRSYWGNIHQKTQTPVVGLKS